MQFYSIVFYLTFLLSLVYCGGFEPTCKVYKATDGKPGSGGSLFICECSITRSQGGGRYLGGKNKPQIKCNGSTGIQSCKGDWSKPIENWQYIIDECSEEKVTVSESLNGSPQNTITYGMKCDKNNFCYSEGNINKRYHKALKILRGKISKWWATI